MITEDDIKKAASLDELGKLVLMALLERKVGYNNALGSYHGQYERLMETYSDYVDLLEIDNEVKDSRDRTYEAANLCFEATRRERELIIELKKEIVNQRRTS